MTVLQPYSRAVTRKSKSTPTVPTTNPNPGTESTVGTRPDCGTSGCAIDVHPLTDFSSDIDEVTAAIERGLSCGISKALTEPTVDEIAQEAYLIWLQTGGNDVVNWLEAEARLRSRVADPSSPVLA